MPKASIQRHIHFRCTGLSLLFILYVPVNNFSAMSGWVFLGWTSTKQRIKCLAHGHNTVPLVRLEHANPGLKSNTLPLSHPAPSYLTHTSLASFLWVIGKQCKPRPDAAECGIWSGSPMFAYRMFYQNLNKNENYDPTTLKTEMDWSDW